MNLTSVRPRSARLAVTLALATAVAWTAKAAAIGVAGGLGRSPAEGPLFLVGLALAVAAAMALGVAAAALWTRSTVLRVLGAVIALGLVALVGTLAQLVVVALRPAQPGWVWGELNLWAAAVALLAGSLAVRARAGRTTAGTTPGQASGAGVPWPTGSAGS